MRTTFAGLSIAVLVLAGICALTGSAQRAPHVTGFFTNMKYVGAGDVLGIEV